MPFSATHADVEIRANVGGFRADMAEIQGLYARTTGAMSTEALRAAAAQEKLDRALARSGPESLAAKNATLAYRREMEALRLEQGASARVQATAAEAARATVRGNLAQRESIVKLAAEYRRVAQAAAAGSREQVEALRLARLEWAKLGITAARTGEEVAVASTRGSGAARHTALRQEERNLGRFGRGVLAGGLREHGTRALAFGSGALIGGYGLEHAVTAVADAAIEHQATQAQQVAALKAAGIAYGDYREQIERTLFAQENLTGFTEEDTSRSFIRLVRTTKDVGDALRYNALAANIARGANIGLDQASKIVVKALAGQTTGLRRLGVDLPKGVSGYRALEIAAQKFGGSSAAYAKTAAGAQARLHNEIHQTEVTIGTGLLPSLTRYESKAATWLGQSRNQARIQRDVTQALHAGGQAVHGLGDAYHLIAPPIRAVNRLLGGSRHTVELLALAFVGLKVRALAADLGLLATRTRAVGAAAGVAAAEVGALGEAEAVAGAGAGGGVRAAGGRIGRRGVGALGTLARNVGPQLVIADAALFVQDELSHHTKGHIKGPGGIPEEVFQQNGRYYTRVAVGRAIVTKEVSVAEAARLLGYTPKPSADTGFRAADLSGPAKRSSDGPPHPAPKRLDRASQLANDLSAAQLAVARGTPGAGDRLVTALKAKIDFDRHYEGIQQGLLDRHSGDPATHEKILEGLRADEQSNLSDLHGIEQERARKAHDVTERARKAHAETQRKREQAAKAAHDVVLKQRRARLRRLTEVPVELRIEEATAKANHASAQRLATIYEQERKALEQQVATLRKIGASKELIAKAKEHEASVQGKIDALQKHKKAAASSTSDVRANEQEFLGAVQTILHAYAPNAFGRTDTRLYELVHETRKQTRHLSSIAGRAAFPGTRWADESADAVTG